MRCLLRVALLGLVTPAVSAATWSMPGRGELEVEFGLEGLESAGPEDLARRFIEDVVVSFVGEYPRRLQGALVQALLAHVEPWVAGELAARLQADEAEVVASLRQEAVERTIALRGSSGAETGARDVLVELRFADRPARVFRVSLVEEGGRWRVDGFASPCPSCPRSEATCPTCKGSGLVATRTTGFPWVEEPPTDLPAVDATSPDALVLSYWRLAPVLSSTIQARILHRLTLAHREAFARYASSAFLEREASEGRSRGSALLTAAAAPAELRIVRRRRLPESGHTELGATARADASKRQPPDILFEMVAAGDSWRLVAIRERCVRCAASGGCGACEGVGRRVDGSECPVCRSTGRCPDCEGRGYRLTMLF